MNILIIDDELEVLEILSYFLSEADYRVYQAENLKKAEEIINYYHIDYIFVDGHVNGELSKDFILKYKDTIPLCLVTGDTELEVISKELNVVDFLKKPFTSTQLKDKVKKVESNINSEKVI